MLAPQRLSELLDKITREHDTDANLNELNRAMLELTGSRNAMIARMNDELGYLEMRHGLGSEWSHGIGQRVHIEVGTKKGIVAYVAATGKSFISGNVQEEPRYRNIFGTTRSEIAAPIKDQYERIRGVVNVESDKRDAYTDEDLEVCTAIASLSAIVLEREESRIRERAFVEIGSALDRATTEDELIESVILIAGGVLRFQAFSIFLLDARTDSFVLRGSVGDLKSQIGQIAYTRGEGFTGWVLEHGRPILLHGPHGDPRWRGKFTEFPSDQIASFLAVPVVYRGKVTGVLRVLRRTSENKYLDNRFTEADQRVLVAIAEAFATGLEGIRSVEKMIRAERMVAWGELSAKSSHMIGNRMFALKGDVNELGHLLADREPDIAELRELQKSLDTNVRRVEEILQDFRDFVTATQLHKEKTDLNALVEETLKEVFPRRSPVKLETQLGAKLPSVPADSKKLRRALAELIENSMNYMEDGALCVCTSMADQDSIRRAHLPPAKYLQLEIQDTGPGVKEDQKNLIFQPFFSNRVKGMGLGLSIVKGIIDAHSGGIYEAGLEGQGAKFVILLPALDRSQSEET